MEGEEEINLFEMEPRPGRWKKRVEHKITSLTQCEVQSCCCNDAVGGFCVAFDHGFCLLSLSWFSTEPVSDPGVLLNAGCQVGTWYKN